MFTKKHKKGGNDAHEKYGLLALEDQHFDAGNYSSLMPSSSSNETFIHSPSSDMHVTNGMDEVLHHSVRTHPMFNESGTFSNDRMIEHISHGIIDNSVYPSSNGPVASLSRPKVSSELNKEFEIKDENRYPVPILVPPSPITEMGVRQSGRSREESTSAIREMKILISQCKVEAIIVHKRFLQMVTSHHVIESMHRTPSAHFSPKSTTSNGSVFSYEVGCTNPTYDDTVTAIDLGVLWINCVVQLFLSWTDAISDNSIHRKKLLNSRLSNPYPTGKAKKNGILLDDAHDEYPEPNISYSRLLTDYSQFDSDDSDHTSTKYPVRSSDISSLSGNLRELKRESTPIPHRSPGSLSNSTYNNSSISSPNSVFPLTKTGKSSSSKKRDENISKFHDQLRLWSRKAVEFFIENVHGILANARILSREIGHPENENRIREDRDSLYQLFSLCLPSEPESDEHPRTFPRGVKPVTFPSLSLLRSVVYFLVKSFVGTDKVIYSPRTRAALFFFCDSLRSSCFRRSVGTIRTSFQELYESKIADVKLSEFKKLMLIPVTLHHVRYWEYSITRTIIRSLEENDITRSLINTNLHFPGILPAHDIQCKVDTRDYDCDGLTVTKELRLFNDMANNHPEQLGTSRLESCSSAEVNKPLINNGVHKSTKKIRKSRKARLAAAAVLGGAVLGLSGGIAFPFVAAGIAAMTALVGTTAIGAAVGSAGATLLSVGAGGCAFLFGAGGVGLTAWKMSKRYGDLGEFLIVRLSKRIDIVQKRAGDLIERNTPSRTSSLEHSIPTLTPTDSVLSVQTDSFHTTREPSPERLLTLEQSVPNTDEEKIDDKLKSIGSIFPFDEFLCINGYLKQLSQAANPWRFANSVVVHRNCNNAPATPDADVDDVDYFSSDSCSISDSEYIPNSGEDSESSRPPSISEGSEECNDNRIHEPGILAKKCALKLETKHIEVHNSSSIQLPKKVKPVLIDIQQTDMLLLKWESSDLVRLGDVIARLVTTQVTQQAASIWLQTALGTTAATAMFPVWVLRCIADLDNIWLVVRAKAKLAGEALFAALKCSPKPVTIVSYGAGTRVAFNAMLRLFDEGLFHVIQDVVFLGAPLSKSSRWPHIRSVVSGRVINCYSKNDWVLAFMYRYMEWGISAAGLGPVIISRNNEISRRRHTSTEINIHENNNDNSRTSISKNTQSNKKEFEISSSSSSVKPSRRSSSFFIPKMKTGITMQSQLKSTYNSMFQVFGKGKKSEMNRHTGNSFLQKPVGNRVGIITDGVSCRNLRNASEGLRNSTDSYTSDDNTGKIKESKSQDLNSPCTTQQENLTSDYGTDIFPGITNYDVSDLVSSHYDYQKALESILYRVGIFP